jgi:thiol-disulfide isomerase/thioredoxin
MREAFCFASNGARATEGIQCLRGYKTGTSSPISPSTSSGAERSRYRAISLDLTVVLFYRGSWCPYCCAQLAAFSRACERLAAAGVAIVALSGSLLNGAAASADSTVRSAVICCVTSEPSALKFG